MSHRAQKVKKDALAAAALSTEDLLFVNANEGHGDTEWYRAAQTELEVRGEWTASGYRQKEG